MKKTLSLKEPKEFQRVINKGKWYGGNLISTYILSNNTEVNYIGLAVSKKAGKATKRNKVKRIIRAAYLEIEKDVNVGNNIVFVWRAKALYSDLNYINIKKDIEKAFKKAGMLK